MKSIIVVTTKDLKNHGRLLCHLLSKQNNIKAVLWDFKDYDGNEKQVSGTNYFIFLGDNEVTKTLTPLVENWLEEQGVRIGFDYRKAFIQQYEKPTNNELLYKAIMKYLEDDLIPNFGPIIAPGQINLPPITIALRYIKLCQDRKNATMNQYTFGIKKFMEESLEEFLNN